MQHDKLRMSALSIFIAVNVMWIMHRINVDSKSDNYRLGDLVMRNGPHYLSCSEYPGSMACEFNKQNVSGAQGLTNVVRDFANATVVHARVGDALYGPSCWDNEADCLVGCYCKVNNGTYTDTICQGTCMERPYALSRSYYDDITPPTGEHIIILYGHHITLSMQKDTDYITSMAKYWEARGYSVHLMEGANADRDMLTMAKAPVFVQSGGGYSGLAALANNRMGGKQLISAQYKHCPGYSRNALCKRKLPSEPAMRHYYASGKIERLMLT